MDAPPPFVDLHLHAEGIDARDLATLRLFGLEAAVTCSNDAGASSAFEVRRHWDELVQVQTARLEAAGIRPFVALAVHPARIPWHSVDDLLHRLPRYFDDPRVAAMGELGLQEGGAREEEILARQLELAVALGRPVIIHTPGREKLSRTRRLLAILRESRLPPGRALVDHVDVATLPLVRACGHWAGLTIQPGGFDPDEASALLSRNGAERIVMTSDIGEGAADLLALPRALEAVREAGLPGAVARRVMVEGPLAFLGQG